MPENTARTAFLNLFFEVFASVLVMLYVIIIQSTWRSIHHSWLDSSSSQDVAVGRFASCAHEQRRQSLIGGIRVCGPGSFLHASDSTHNPQVCGGEPVSSFFPFPFCSFCTLDTSSPFALRTPRSFLCFFPFVSYLRFLKLWVSGLDFRG